MMRSHFSCLISFMVAAFLFLAGGCDQFPLHMPTPTASMIPPTITASLTPTATRIWFPATDTPRPLATFAGATPTQDFRPVEGAVLIQDDFTQPNRWNTINTAYGSVAYGKDELTIALKEERHSLYAFFLEPVPENYYLEMTINPSLCKGEDQYGITFRTQSNSQFYRFLLRCDGLMRIDLVQGEAVAPITVVESSGAFRPGPLQEHQVALWLHGDEVRVYVNDEYQMSAHKLRWLNGGLGVFARSTGGAALTVNYSELTVRASITFPPTPIPSVTPLPSTTPTPLKKP